MNQKKEFKVTTIGASGVGKTSIINRFYFGTFNEMGSPTVGAAYVKCQVELPSGLVVLNLWDTAGQEKYANLVPVYMRDSNAVIVVFDLTQPNQMESVQGYINMIRDSLPPEVPIILAGNKADLASGNAGYDVHSWAMSNSIPSFSVSAKTGQGIDDLFHAVAEGSLQKLPVVTIANKKLAERRDREENPSGCC